MAYTKQNFEDGQVLKAEHLNNMEQGIEDAHKIIVTEGSDTLTWDGNTEGLVGSGDYYKVSDVVPTMGDLDGGCTYVDNTDTVFDCSVADTTIFELDGVLAIGMAIICVPTEQAGVMLESVGMVFPEAGTYFGVNADGHTKSLTIPGYTGFVTEKIDTKYLPEHLQFGDVPVTLYEGTGLEPISEDGVYILVQAVDFDFVAGELYKVVIDGVEYTCDCLDYYGLCLVGNPMYFDVGDDNGIPFAMAVGLLEAGQITLISANNFGALTITMQRVQKIDEKYLPPSGSVFYSAGLNYSSYLYRTANDTTADNRVTLSELIAAVKRGEQVYVHINSAYMAATHIFDNGTYGIVRTLTTTGDSFKFNEYHTAEYAAT